MHAPTEVGRKFTDLQGFVNQYLASRVDAVCLTQSAENAIARAESRMSQSDAENLMGEGWTLYLDP